VEYLLSQLSLKNAEIASLKRRLRHVAEAQEFLPELRFQTASIIKLGNTRIGETLIINRGRQDEVRVGDAVLQGQSLVGTIARLGPRTSLLQLISSPGSLVAARTGTSRENCSIAGAGQNRAKVVFYHENVKAAQGEVLFTSGLTGNLPENIFVGVLAEAPGEGVEPGTFEASINLRADFSTLESLLLIRRVNQISSEVEDAERDR
jgi:cell shape-determining protein MreC